MSKRPRNTRLALGLGNTPASSSKDAHVEDADADAEDANADDIEDSSPSSTSPSSSSKKKKKKKDKKNKKGKKDKQKDNKDKKAKRQQETAKAAAKAAAVKEKADTAAKKSADKLANAVIAKCNPVVVSLNAQLTTAASAFLPTPILAQAKKQMEALQDLVKRAQLIVDSGLPAETLGIADIKALLITSRFYKKGFMVFS